MPQQFQTEIDVLRKLNEDLQNAYWNRYRALFNLAYPSHHEQITDSIAIGQIAKAQHCVLLAVAALMEANVSAILLADTAQLVKDLAPKSTKGGVE